MNVLLVTSELELGAEIQRVVDEVTTARNPPTVVIPVDSYNRAHLMLTSAELQFHLLITDGEDGLELIEWMRDNGTETPALLAMPELVAHDVANRISRCHRTRVVQPATLKAALLEEQQIHGTARQRRLEIELHLVKDPGSRRFEVKGPDFDYSESGELEFDDGYLPLMKTLSRKLPNSDDFQEDCELIGNALLNQLFTRNADFAAAVKHGLRQSGDLLENTTVRFVIDQAFYPVVLEALPDPQTRQDRWGRVAPVYRRLEHHNWMRTLHPLFWHEEDDREPLNCLIVDAGDTDGFVECPRGKEQLLKPLAHVQRECESIRRCLDDAARTTHNIGAVRVISRNDLKGRAECSGGELSRDEFSQYVQEVLEQRTWHLVHYCGHSYSGENEEDACVFFQDRYVTAVSIRDFSGWLRRTRFVFLSSCHSSDERFAYALVRHQVPAVSGFRWAIDDELAADFATNFYHHMLRERALDRAYLLASKHLFDTNIDQRAWAAPVLVMQ